MTGHTSDETTDIQPEHHSDAESLRHIPPGYDERGVVQDQPGTHGSTVESGNPNRQKDETDDDTNGRTLKDDLTAQDSTSQG